MWDSFLVVSSILLIASTGIQWVEAACATTNTDGTCASCADSDQQYGPYCLACPCTDAVGVCSSGVNGNGRCTACSDRRYGAYCDRSALMSSLLLEWPQINVGVGCFAMGFSVLWVYYRVFIGVRAERRYFARNSGRLKHFAAACRAAHLMDEAEKRTRMEQRALEDAMQDRTEALDMTPAAGGQRRPGSEALSPTSGSEDEPGIQFFATDLRQSSTFNDRPAVVNVRSPQPKERGAGPHDPFESIPSARLFASNSRSPGQSHLELDHQHYRAHPQRFDALDVDASPASRYAPRQAASLGYDDFGGTSAVSRGGGPAGPAGNSLRRASSHYAGGHLCNDASSFGQMVASSVFDPPSEISPTTIRSSPPGSSLRPQRPSQRRSIFGATATNNVSNDPPGTSRARSSAAALGSSVDRPIGMTTRELLRPSSPLPRFRPGDKVRRNARHVATACDFGGNVGDVLCGECVTIQTIIVKRDPEKGVAYSFTAVGGDHEPSVPDALEDLFEVASSNSSSDQSN